MAFIEIMDKSAKKLRYQSGIICAKQVVLCPDTFINEQNLIVRVGSSTPGTDGEIFEIKSKVHIGNFLIITLILDLSSLIDKGSVSIIKLAKKGYTNSIPTSQPEGQREGQLITCNQHRIKHYSVEFKIQQYDQFEQTAIEHITHAKQALSFCEENMGGRLGRTLKSLKFKILKKNFL